MRSACCLRVCPSVQTAVKLGHYVPQIDIFLDSAMHIFIGSFQIFRKNCFMLPSIHECCLAVALKCYCIYMGKTNKMQVPILLVFFMYIYHKAQFRECKVCQCPTGKTNISIQKHQKKKLYKTNAAVWCNKTCRQKHPTPNYISIKINGNNQQKMCALCCFCSYIYIYIYIYI